jgi:hypothetical protein
MKPASVSAYADQEYVDAGKVPVMMPKAGGGTEVRGAYAFWVGDEGVKISAWVPAPELPPGGRRVTVATAPANVARLGTAFQEFDTANAARVIAYEQATNLSYAAGAKLTAASLRDGFHHVTLTHRRVNGGGYFAGQVNLNTTSAMVWRSLVESYETAPGAKPFGTATKRTQTINALAGGIAGSASGKPAHAPYGSVEAFLQSDLLASAVSGKNGIDPAEFAAALAPMLTVRSDTFRVRAYGEAANRVDPDTIEAVAYCEAIVQRTPYHVLGGAGRQFEVIYFRWLGLDDI